MFYTFATQECVYNNLYRRIVTGRWWRNIQRWDGGEDSAVGSPGGFGDTEKCGYLYSDNIPIKYSDYEQVISIGICDYLSAVFLWENE